MSEAISSHPQIQDGWFREKPVLWPGQAMCLEIQEVLCHEKSLYQDVLIFKSVNYGTVLVLDGVIQCTERDEFSYQEMITHLPMNCHPNPERVLVIGGGDGGVLREVAKHKTVKEIVLCDIDESVIRLSKKYLPGMSIGFDNPNLTVHIGDGFEFLKDKTNTFDIIITDASDPVGPAESLFQVKYFELMRNALRPGGIISTQGECQWLHLKLITDVTTYCRKIFPVVEYAYATIPTYPSGQIGFVLCGADPNTDLKKPLRKWTEEEEEELCRYYNAEIHEASFILPQFTKSALKKSLSSS